MNGVVKDSAKNKVMMGKDRDAHNVPVLILQGASQENNTSIKCVSKLI
jgi:hypothetical protein